MLARIYREIFIILYCFDTCDFSASLSLISEEIIRDLQVEQLHKIFKLCGSPPDDYWKKSRLPHATLFKPQQPYDSCLRETFSDLPAAAVDLIGTLLSVEPHKRGNTSSALASEVSVINDVLWCPFSLVPYNPLIRLASYAFWPEILDISTVLKI